MGITNHLISKKKVRNIYYLGQFKLSSRKCWGWEGWYSASQIKFMETENKHAHQPDRPLASNTDFDLPNEVHVSFYSYLSIYLFIYLFHFSGKHNQIKDIPTGQLQKQSRTRFTSEQRYELERAFNQSHYVTPHSYHMLQKLGIPKSTIMVYTWYVVVIIC